MKRTLKTKIIKKTASILTATVIFSSGGLTIITNIFGLSKNNKNQINKEISHSKIISNYESSNKTINLEQSKYKYKYKPSEDNKSIIIFFISKKVHLQ